MARSDRDSPDTGVTRRVTGAPTPQETPLLETATGRSPPDRDPGGVPPSARQEEIRAKSGGGRPVGDHTGRPLSGTGAIETDDGLDERSEAARRAAEDLPADGIEAEGRDADRPVFDRRDEG